MTKEENVERIIIAAVRYSELAERHLADSKWRAATMKAAAAAARRGDKREAQSLKNSVDLRATVVFNYDGVHSDLIRAVKPFKTLKRYSR